MAAPLAKGISTAAKRTRSQDSLLTLEAQAVQSGSGDSEDATEDQHLPAPAFLNQTLDEISSKFNELNWQEKIRIAQGRVDPESQWVQDLSPETLVRNRYLGVQPWHKSRIRLKVAKGTSDYINASPISIQDPFTGDETKYIATQGPKKSSTSHFWQMIWHETAEVAVIVMLTPTKESGREKCFQYFPLDADSSPLTIFGDPSDGNEADGLIVFTDVEEQYGPNTQVRKLSLGFGDQSKVVWHLLFTAFPDFGAPEGTERAELLRLLSLSQDKNTAPDNPRIIHCSAGVGRSGTFIALEYLLALTRTGEISKFSEKEDPIYDIVSNLREQRMMMVQSEVQYHLLYEVVAEAFSKLASTKQVAVPPRPKARRLVEESLEPLANDDPRVAESVGGKAQEESSPTDVLQPATTESAKITSESLP